MANTKNKYWAGFDLGGTKMYVAVFNESLKLVGQKRRKTKGSEGQETGLDRMVKTVREACEESGINPADLAGIGVGCPGPLNLDKGILVEAANLGWSNAPVRDRLEDAFGCPVTLGNDVDVGVLGEYLAGAGQNGRCVLGVFPGTGIGAGCVYEGRVITGGAFTCMEMGHIQVLPNGPLCGCGRYGCLEAVASRLAIAGEAAKAVCRGQAPHLKALAGADVEKIRSGTLKRAIEAGDAVVEQIVRDAARAIGVGVANLVNLLAPDIVVLGGGLVEALPALFTEEVGNSARARVMPSFVKTFRVNVASLGDDAGVYGAALMARNAVQKGSGGVIKQ